MSDSRPKHSSDHLSEALRQWDPYPHHGNPSPERIRLELDRLRAASRDGAGRKSERHPSVVGPGGLRWAAAAALAAAGLVAALATRTSLDRRTPVDMAGRAPESVQWQMTASNGVRVYWNLTLANDTGEER